MDENIIQHNHDDDDETLEVRPLPKEFVDDKGAVLVPMLPDRSSNGHNGHEESRQPVALSASRARGRRISAPAVDISASASRRARVNRILMYRRRHKRYGHVDQTGPRMVAAISIILAVLFTLLSGTMGAAFAYYQSQLPLLNGIADHTQFQTTHIYDRHGQLLYNLYDPRYGRRTYVSYSDISPLLINATVAAEDHTFWTNSGVDIQGILRAAATNFQNQTVVEGGSTITQQLIKNELFLNQPRTVQIKAEEALLAYGLTQQYPKWKIMEMYLNTVYYGDLNYGIEAAAQDFFNLQPKCTKSHCIPAAAQLDLAQASMLAGLPQLPSYYNPIINKQAALDRQKIVLDFMVELHMITPAQEQQAQQEMAKFKFQSFSSKQGMQAPHFVRYVIDEVLVPLFGADNLFTGGYNIYTTLDLNLEKKVEQITYDHLYKVTCDNYLGCYGPLDTQNQVHNAAVVVENPFNGEILAMNGSANFNDNSPGTRQIQLCRRCPAPAGFVHQAGYLRHCLRDGLVSGDDYSRSQNHLSDANRPKSVLHAAELRRQIPYGLSDDGAQRHRQLVQYSGHRRSRVRGHSQRAEHGGSPGTDRNRQPQSEHAWPITGPGNGRSLPAASHGRLCHLCQSRYSRAPDHRPGDYR